MAISGVGSGQDRRSDRGLPGRVAGPLAGILLGVASLSPGQVRAEEAVECPKAAEKYLRAAEAAAPGVREHLRSAGRSYFTPDTRTFFQGFARGPLRAAGGV